MEQNSVQTPLPLQEVPKDDSFNTQGVTQAPMDMKDKMGYMMGVSDMNSMMPPMPEPAMPEPPMPEPAMPEPAMPEPPMPEPAMPEPPMPEPAMPEPVMPEPPIPEPAMPEPAMPEPMLEENNTDISLSNIFDLDDSDENENEIMDPNEGLGEGPLFSEDSEEIKQDKSECPECICDKETLCREYREPPMYNNNDIVKTDKPMFENKSTIESNDLSSVEFRVRQTPEMYDDINDILRSSTGDVVVNKPTRKKSKKKKPKGKKSKQKSRPTSNKGKIKKRSLASLRKELKRMQSKLNNLTKKKPRRKNKQTKKKRKGKKQKKTESFIDEVFTN
jgi:hypothetical protein